LCYPHLPCSSLLTPKLTMAPSAAKTTFLTTSSTAILTNIEQWVPPTAPVSTAVSGLTAILLSCVGLPLFLFPDHGFEDAECHGYIFDDLHDLGRQFDRSGQYHLYGLAQCVDDFFHVRD